MGANYAQRGPIEHMSERERDYLASYLALPTILAAKLARGQVSGPEEKGVCQCCREQSSQGRIFEIAGAWAWGVEKLRC